MTDDHRFAANVRAARAKAGLSQEEVAARAKIHPTEVSRLERGVRDPRLKTIVRIARGVGVKPAALLEGVE